MILKDRPKYLDTLLAVKDNGMIKVLTGMRRCGKSSLLMLLADRLTTDCVPDDHIITMNLESFQYHGFDEEDLYRAVTGHMSDGHYYVLLDEVQLVDHWERAVNALLVDADADIYITGSNAHLLSGQLATLLSGRHIEIGIGPLSFAEFMQYSGMTDPTAAFDRYTRYGGLPPVVDQGANQELSHTVLSGIYNTILVHDISQYLQIRNPAVFHDVARYLADTAGSPVSIANIEHRLKSARRAAAPDTIDRYLSGMTDAFLFAQARRLNIKGGEYLQGLSKYYPTDLGIRNMLLGYPTGDYGFLLENAVYNEFRGRGYTIQVGRMDTLEIDFVATRIQDDMTADRLYVQVSASIMDATTRSRELEPLSRVRKLGLPGKCMVLTLDRFGLGEVGGIDIVNALDWMTAGE